MFWNTIGIDYLVEGKELQKKLAEPDVKLQTIIDDVNCLQEIRNNNTDLLSFLKKEAVFRELVEAVLCPTITDASFQKDKYGFVHRCSEALTLAPREFYNELVKYEELVHKLTDFLSTQSGNLNHLIVSFYCKVIISFLSTETYPFLNLLEESNFLENCIESLEFCAVFELLCSIGNCLPDPSYRNQVKQWYVRKGFAARLLDSLSLEKPSEIHENAAALWTEFIKALRELQYNVEVCEDPLLDSLQSEQCVRELLARMFPENSSEYSASIVVNGCCILNTLLETNYIKDAPSVMINRELLQSANTSSYSGNFDEFNCIASTQPTTCLVIDPKRIVETLCAEYSSRFMRVVIDSLMDDNELDRDDDALIGCTQILMNLLNTNFLPTHYELLKTFSAEETHFTRLIEFVRFKNPSFSIFNSLLNNIILYILYSSTGAEKSLINFLIKDFNLPQAIRCATEEHQGCGETDCESTKYQKTLTRLELISKRTFFLQLANRLVHCQLNAQNGEYIETLIRNVPDYEEWVEFSSRSIELFADRNRSDKVLSTTTRSSNAIEIDEIKDMPFFMDDSAPRAGNESPEEKDLQAAFSSFTIGPPTSSNDKLMNNNTDDLNNKIEEDAKLPKSAEEPQTSTTANSLPAVFNDFQPDFSAAFGNGPEDIDENSDSAAKLFEELGKQKINSIDDLNEK